MYTHEMMHPRKSLHLTNQINKTQNNLAVNKIDRFFNENTHQLTLIISTHELLDGEVHAFLKDNILLVEALIQLEFNKPYRMHLRGKNIQDSDMEVSLVGFSEIRLEEGYHYSLTSCELVNPMLIKVVLNRQVSHGKAFHFKKRRHHHWN